MFEHRSSPLVPFRVFLQRSFRFFGYALVLLSISLGIGMAGYSYFADLPMVDAFLNAAMILTGMGPINPMKTNAAKIFAGFYALFSGIAFLSTVAVMIAPIAHRFLHWIHLDDEEEKGGGQD